MYFQVMKLFANELCQYEYVLFKSFIYVKNSIINIVLWWSTEKHIWFFLLQIMSQALWVCFHFSLHSVYISFNLVLSLPSINITLSFLKSIKYSLNIFLQFSFISQLYFKLIHDIWGTSYDYFLINSHR